MRRLTMLLGFGVAFATPAAAQYVEPKERAPIREWHNGAGPTHIFRITTDGDRDVFGVVDPVFWTIRYYTLKHWTGIEDNSFASRWAPAGGCRLPPFFRIWRVHQLRTRVVLQSQPVVEFGKLSLPVDRQPMVTFKVTIPTANGTGGLKGFAEGKRVVFDTPPDENTLCGDVNPGAMRKAITEGVGSAGAPAFATPSDEGISIVGGENRPFVVTRLPGLASIRPKSIDSSKLTVGGRGDFLVSAQELETSRSSTAVSARNILVTRRLRNTVAQLTYLGAIRTDLSIERRTSGKPQRMTILNGQRRMKMGQRMIAIASTGEVLVLGNADHGFFTVTACHFAAVNSLCGTSSGADEMPVEDGWRLPVADGVEPGESQLNWGLGNWLANTLMTFDASTIPEACRDKNKCSGTEIWGLGNPFATISWAPLADLRLERGPVTRRGFPYASPGPNSALIPKKIGEIPAWPAIVPSRNELPSHKLIGDIENNEASANTGAIAGIDCSLLLARVWGAGYVATGQLMDAVREGTRAVRPEIGYMRQGDAIAINLSNDKPVINHVVVFREHRHVSVKDRSMALLVLESSSACGGVCWSYFDESFFHGWTMLAEPNAVVGGAKPTAVLLDKASPSLPPSQLKIWQKVYARASL